MQWEIRMESEKKFEEGIKSYATRIVTEMHIIWVESGRLSDHPDSSIYTHRMTIREMRKSLDKVNSYMKNLETIVEKEYGKKTVTHPVGLFDSKGGSTNKQEDDSR